MMWPFKWKLSASAFTWCHLFSQLSQHEICKFGQNLLLAEFGSERVKHQHKTTWNGNKRHKDGLNTDRDIAYSSKREATTLKSTLSYPPATSLRGPFQLVWHCPMNDWEFLTALLLPTILHRTSHSVDHLQPTFVWSVIINSNHLQKYFWTKSTFFLISFLKT